jgi:chromosome segregation ATPase
MSEQRFTDEQLDELLADLSETDPQVRYRSAVASRQDAADAIRQLRERVSLLEGERESILKDKEQIVGRLAESIAALRSQLDEARAQIADMEASPNWLSSHHGEPK